MFTIMKDPASTVFNGYHRSVLLLTRTVHSPSHVCEGLRRRRPVLGVRRLATLGGLLWAAPERRRRRSSGPARTVRGAAVTRTAAGRPRRRGRGTPTAGAARAPSAAGWSRRAPAALTAAPRWATASRARGRPAQPAPAGTRARPMSGWASAPVQSQGRLQKRHLINHPQAIRWWWGVAAVCVSRPFVLAQHLPTVALNTLQ